MSDYLKRRIDSLEKTVTSLEKDNLSFRIQLVTMTERVGIMWKVVSGAVGLALLSLATAILASVIKAS